MSEGHGRFGRFAGLGPFLDSVDGVGGDGPVVVRHHAGPRDGGGIGAEEEGGGAVGDEAFGWFAEDVVDHAVAEDALEGYLIGFGEGGKRGEGDGFVFGDGGRDVEAGYIVYGEGGGVLMWISVGITVGVFAVVCES